MSEYLEAPKLRHLSYHRGNTTLDRVLSTVACSAQSVYTKTFVRTLRVRFILADAPAGFNFARNVPRGNRTRWTRRNGKRVVGGNGTFVETLSGDQEVEEAIRHLLPLYECRPPLLIAVAPRPRRLAPEAQIIVRNLQLVRVYERWYTYVCVEKIKSISIV